MDEVLIDENQVAFMECRGCSRFEDFVDRKAATMDLPFGFSEDDLYELRDEFRRLGLCPVAQLLEQPFDEVSQQCQPSDCTDFDYLRSARSEAKT